MSDFFGSCFCGKVNFICHGEPFFTQYCHCNKCREVAAMTNRENDKRGYAFTAAYLTTNFTITMGKDNLEEIIRNNAKLLLCHDCKCLIYGISLDPNLQAGIGVNAYNFHFDNGIPEAFKPVRHIWYVNRIKDVDDDLPKFKDAPKDQFGSGELWQA